MKSNSPSPVWQSPAFETRRTVDLLCREFEQYWRTGKPLSIEKFMEKASCRAREELLRELVASEWELREMAGDRPVRSDYCYRFPQLESLWSELEAGVCDSTVPAEPDPGRRMLKVGNEFCGYKILEVLGQGAMGIVFLAEMPVIGHRVALKILATSQLQTPTVTGRFEREARLLSRLDHPGIVPLYSYGESNGIRYLVMKAISGWSLSKVISGTTDESQSRFVACSDESSVVGKIQNFSADGRFEILMDIARQLTQALIAVHDADMLHRDIKPSNIMLSNTGQVFLTDFSLACMVSTSADLTITNEFLGTLRYCAPESLDGVYSRQSDIYSLGLVLLELFTLLTPFNALSRRELLSEKLSGRIPEMQRSSATLPAQLFAILQRMTEYNPASRFQSADAVLASLIRCGMSDDRQIRRPGISKAIVLLSSLTLCLIALLLLAGFDSRLASNRFSEKSMSIDLHEVPVGGFVARPDLKVVDDPELIADFQNGWLIPERAWKVPGRRSPALISLAENGTSLAVSTQGSDLLYGSAESARLEYFRSRGTCNAIALSQSANGHFVVMACQDNGRPGLRKETAGHTKANTASYFVETFSVPDREWRRVGGPLFRLVRDLPHFVAGVAEDRSAVVLIPDSEDPAVWSPQTGGFWPMTWPRIPWVTVAMKFQPILHASVIQPDGTIHAGLLPWQPEGSPPNPEIMEIESDLQHCTSLQFSPRTNHLIAMSDTGVCIVKSDSGKIVAKGVGQLFADAQLQFSDDGEQLIFFDAREVRLFDFQTGAWTGQPLCVENEIVLAAPLSGKQALLVVERSGTIRQVSVDSLSGDSRKGFAELVQRTAVLTSAAFRESAGRLVVGTEDGRLVSLRLR